jgi:hypothetical protein
MSLYPSDPFLNRKPPRLDVKTLACPGRFSYAEYDRDAAVGGPEYEL